MKLHFDSNQEYQLEAIKAVIDIFEGQPLSSGDYSFSLTESGAWLTENGSGNLLVLDTVQLAENIKQVQQRNNITSTQTLLIDEKEEKILRYGMNFSVEMETGTGKTYVYLRTVYELNKVYGFKKFVIVVPSVAIREGVWKNLQITHEHLQHIYNKAPINYEVYDSKKVSGLRSFASSNAIQILVINIDAFAKDINIINKPNDRLTGKRPVEFIQSCKPIVIVDEPQNVETAIRKQAIENLNPLCTLRYSATHTNTYNLVYSLNPVKAYDLGLVKQIEVDSVFSENAANEAFVSLENIVPAKNKITAKLTIDCNTDKGVMKKAFSVRTGDDLYKLSNRREIYSSGFIVDNIDAGFGSVSFTNGNVLQVGQTQGGMHEEIMKYMVRKTVEEHLKKELRYAASGIKVLSLFFIDRVKNYRDYDSSGNAVKGKFATWFEEIYIQEITKPVYQAINGYTAGEVHEGYFSIDNKKRFKDTAGETKADDDTYKLIMQDKERLLDLQTPLRFIFSHSALREGWDNPNVFQICTLNETKSEIKKRQQIGRGLRLCVNQDGERVYDRNMNRLTVIANESYDDFAKALQKEIEQDCGVEFSGRINDKSKRERVVLRKGFEADPKFLKIWERIRHKTRYSVNYDTTELIRLASKAVKEMPETKKPLIRSNKNRLTMTEYGIGGELLKDAFDLDYKPPLFIPDMLAYIQAKTELTRSTILEILKQSGKLNELLINPQLFMDNTVVAIRKVLHEQMIDGIKYNKIGDTIYQMSEVFKEELETYFNKDKTFSISDPGKTIYENLIPLDSSVENQFAKDCETSEDVEFYFKLPSNFKIPTPVGTYNPDWAVVLKGEKKIYFVAETKSAGQELRGSEEMKSKCGKAHFDEFDGVIYKRVSKVNELI